MNGSDQSLTLSSSPSMDSDTTTGTHVYIKDKTDGWIPATIHCRNQDGTVAVVCEGGEERTVNLNDYKPSKHLPLRCVDLNVNVNVNGGVEAEAQVNDGGNRTETNKRSANISNGNGNGSGRLYSDLRHIPYLHEANVLYNLKGRYEQTNSSIYTRAHDRVLIAINPFRWIDGIYADKKRIHYAEQLVWKTRDRVRRKVRKFSSMPLPPHLYEVSSLAMNGIQKDSCDQTIIVSGESGSGKTVASKIIMSHLATFHELKKAYVAQMAEEQKEKRQLCLPQNISVNKIMDFVRASFESFFALFLRSMKQKMKNDGALLKAESFDIEAPIEVKDEEPEQMKQTNLIVQRVLDSNPLLEAFGNAKTQLNDNSSRFSRHSKLQFDVHQGCNIAGSVCETFLLEKSRVVGHDKGSGQERNFHIFYQLMEAPESDRIKIWEGLNGKSASHFRYVGENHNVDEFTNDAAWKNTISALHTLDIHGRSLHSMLHALIAVMQLGNVTFKEDPSDPEGSVVENMDVLEELSEIIGVPAVDIAHALTFKTVTAVHDTYNVPLTVSGASSTCDAFAKQIYSVLFDWLVERTNDATCATKNYMMAKEGTKYSHVAALDLFGFECHEKNNFEQLLINHANERLQKSFTENIIDSVTKEYASEGVEMDYIEREDNGMVLKILEGKMGLIPLLNEECIRPRGSDAGFVNKLYANNSTVRTNSPLVFKKKYNLVATQFGIRHFAGVVDYDATSFVEKNRDTLPDDVRAIAGRSTNDIICRAASSSSQQKSTRKGSLVAASLWTKFEKQMRELFKSISETQITYVRCIIPNNYKRPMEFDTGCVLKQLRSVGLLSALKLSHASFPNKQTFDLILQRFWLLTPKVNEDASLLRKKYAFGKLPKKSSTDTLRKDCEALLHLIFHRRVIIDGDKCDEATSTPMAPFVIGKTKIYFRAGGLEHLEKERTKTIIRSVAAIQRAFRRWQEHKRLNEGKIGDSGKFTFQKIQAAIAPVSNFLHRFFSGNSRPRITYL